MFDYMHLCISVVIWHCLCMRLVACGNVYNAVMVVVMHEVMVYVLDMVLH